MKMSEFLLCGNERIRKSEIIDYWPSKKSGHVDFVIRGRGEYCCEGTVEEFDAELFYSVEQEPTLGPQFDKKPE